jgi:hypothetical protein
MPCLPLDLSMVLARVKGSEPNQRRAVNESSAQSSKRIGWTGEGSRSPMRDARLAIIRRWIRFTSTQTIWYSDRLLTLRIERLFCFVLSRVVFFRLSSLNYLRAKRRQRTGERNSGRKEGWVPLVTEWLRALGTGDRLECRQLWSLAAGELRRRWIGAIFDGCTYFN